MGSLRQVARWSCDEILTRDLKKTQFLGLSLKGAHEISIARDHRATDYKPAITPNLAWGAGLKNPAIPTYTQMGLFTVSNTRVETLSN